MRIKINTANLRIRSNHSTTSNFLGFADAGVHEVLETYKGNDYKWYKIKEGWVAGIEEVEEVADVMPVPRDKTKNQVYIGINDLRIRSLPSTKGESLGFCEKDVYYDVYETSKDAYYTWYRIGTNAWCAGVNGVTYHDTSVWEEPQPVDVDATKNQVYVGEVSLNIRKSYSTLSEKMGVCKKHSNYNVLSEHKDSSYTWYKIGDNAWIAAVDSEVIYYPAGSSRIGPALKEEITTLQSFANLVLKAINKGQSVEHYDFIYNAIKELNNYIAENFDSFEYDYVESKNYDEIDLLYTTDVHGAWVNYSLDGNYLTPIFSYKDVGNYAKKLEENNIKALLVDCGDWSRPSKAYNDYLNTGIMYPAQEMKKQNYFAATYGNHEWRWSQYGEANSEYDIIDKLAGTICACNLYKNGKLVYRPYKTAKIGNKRIAVIGIGYPSANGAGSFSNDVWTYGDYQFEDGVVLFNTVQKYIDFFKENNFDYIVAICHMCKSTYESDSRYHARTDSLIHNTSGLTAVIQGHYNFATNAEVIKDKKNNNVLLAHEAGANLNSFGRLRLKDSKVSSYLLDERTDLNVI